MKIAPIVDALAQRVGVEMLLVPTGQNYDERMSELFFRDLGIRKPGTDMLIL